MLSTIDKDLKMIDGVMHIVPKEYPNWYGIENIGFIWHGSWSDPYIEYDGHQLNSTTIEDSMWERWIYDDVSGKLIPGREKDDEGFGQFMRDNVDEVIGYIEMALESEVA